MIQLNSDRINNGWDREIRTPEMTGSEPVALPLGYIPMRMYYYTHGESKCNCYFDMQEPQKKAHKVPFHHNQA